MRLSEILVNKVERKRRAAARAAKARGEDPQAARDEVDAERASRAENDGANAAGAAAAAGSIITGS